LPEELVMPLVVFMSMPLIPAPVTPTGTVPVTEIAPAVVTIDPLLKATPWFPPATAAEVPFNVISPPLAVSTPPAFNEIPALVVAPTPLAVKFMAVKPVVALLFVIAAEIEMNAFAVRVKVVAALHVNAELTVIEPASAHPAQFVALVLMVTFPLARLV
jgi:hypothetical protein